VTDWNSSDTACSANCSTIDYCLTCTVASPSSSPYVQCTSCSSGYSVNPFSNSCGAVCGDGVV
jgi:hypothetical protein